MAYSEGNIKFTMMIKRRSDFSEEEFHKYWTETHAPIVDKWLAKHGVIRYVQAGSSVARSFNLKMAEDLTIKLVPYTKLSSKPNRKVELTAPDLEALQSALNDPYYKSDVEPDEKKFLDAEKSVRTMGWEELKIEDNKVLRS